jgi:prepilin peptidase CpaA
VAAAVLLLAAMAVDVRSRRIPNALTFPAIVAALVIRASLEGRAGVAAAVAGGIVAPGVLMLLRAFRRLGMGDVKLAVAVGALLGPAAGAAAMLASAAVGGALALGAMLRPGSAGARALSPFFLGVPVLERVYRATDPSETPVAPTATIPYGVAIGVGSLLTLAILRWT